MDKCLVRKRNKAGFSLSPIFNHSSATLATASSTAPRSSKHPPQSWRDAQQHNTHNTPLFLYDPYGDMLSFSQFGDLVRDSFILPESPTSQNVEAGQAPPQPPPSPPRRRARVWGGFIFTLIRQTFSCLQMRLPSMYFLRVAAIIRESGISMADFASIQRRGPQQAFMRMTLLVGTHSIPNINKIHYKRFKKKWKAFVMRCMEEWRNLNILSALLLR